MGSVAGRVGWSLSLAVAVGLSAAGCVRFTPSEDMAAYQQLTRDKERMRRAELLSPVEFRQSQHHHAKARRACRQKDQTDCDRHAAVARRKLLSAIDNARWLDPQGGAASTLGGGEDLAFSDKALTSATFEELSDLRYEELERIRLLEMLRAKAKEGEDRAMIDGLIDRHRDDLSRVIAAEQFKRIAVQQQRQQRKMERERAREREREALVAAATDAFGARHVSTNPDGVSIVIRQLFRGASAAVDAGRSGPLLTVARLAREFPRYRIVVEGHTDSKGRGADNELLSLSRAQAVADFLVAKMIAQERITTVGMGEARPVASNANPAGRAANRRVVVIFLF